MDNEKEIKRIIVGLSEYLQVTLSPEQIKMYAKDLLDIGPEGLGEAIKRLKNDPDVWPGRFPLPGKLKGYLVPPIDSEAKKIVALIFECVQIYGSTNQAEAKEHMGSAAWEVCKQYGGYGNICNMETHHKPTIYAQLRDMAENTIYRDRNKFGVPQLDTRKTAKRIEGQNILRQEEPTEIGSLLSQVLPKDS